MIQDRAQELVAAGWYRERASVTGWVWKHREFGVALYLLDDAYRLQKLLEQGRIG